MESLNSSRLPRLASFFVLLSLALLAACATYAALVLHQAHWLEARSLDAIFPFYKWRTRPFTAAELGQTQRLLSVGAALLLLATLGWGLRPAGRREVVAWAHELRSSATSLVQTVAALPANQRRATAWVFGALTALRIWLSLPSVTPEYDDAASYTLFVSKGILAVSAYYPIPNNHVLSNTLSWVFYQVHPGFWWTMRLPVILAATAATMLLFAGLLHQRLAFRPALLALVLFSLAQLSLYHVAVGRGYWLLTLLAGVVFFSMLAHSAGTARPRAAWTGLVIGGILGAYTVPTFAVVLASAFSWLGFKWIMKRQGADLLRLVVAAGLVIVCSILLYAPLLFVSGPNIFFGNGFVAPRPFGEFIIGLPTFLWQTEGFLAGQIALGGLLTIVGLGSAIVLLRWARAGRLPARIADFWLRLAPPALWFIAVPYVVLMAQRVFAPGRTLMYKAFFFFVLLAMVIEWLLQSWPLRNRRWLRPTLITAAIFWTSYQFVSLWRDNRVPRAHNADYHAAFTWLAARPQGPVLVPEPTHSIFLRLYFLSERPNQPWRLDGRPQPGTAYAYVVAFPNKRGYFQPVFSYPPAFHNAEVDIYQVPITGSPPAGLPSYWHLNE